MHSTLRTKTLPLRLHFREVVTPQDIASIRALVEATGFFTPQEVDVAVEVAQDRSGDYQFLLAEDRGMLVGYSCYGHIAVTESAYDLYWIVVSPEYQGSGIGRQLMNATEDSVRQVSGTRLFAETSSQLKYQPTQRFYAQCGFKQESVIQDYYAAGDHQLIYSKTL